MGCGRVRRREGGMNGPRRWRERKEGTYYDEEGENQ